MVPLSLANITLVILLFTYLSKVVGNVVRGGGYFIYTKQENRQGI